MIRSTINRYRAVNLLSFAKIAPVLLLINILLVYRYAQWGTSENALLHFLIALCFGEILLFFSLSRFNSLINPYSIYSIFVILFSFSFILISKKQLILSDNSLIIIRTSIISFILGLFIADKYDFRIINLTSKKTDLSGRILYILFIASILSFIYWCFKLHFVPMFSMFHISVYPEINKVKTTPLHNLITASSVLSTLFYVQFKCGKLSKNWALTFCLICAFITINTFSRQFIVLSILGFFIAYSYFNLVSNKETVTLIICLLFIFMAINILRNNSLHNFHEENKNLKQYSQINLPTNILESYITLYGALNFSTLEKIAAVSNQESHWGLGRYSLRPIVIAFGNKSKLYRSKFNTFNLLGTYSLDSYLDFRFFGVIVFNFLYGLASMRAYLKYLKRESPQAIIEWTILAFCIFMSGFANYFSATFIWFFLLINRLAFLFSKQTLCAF